MDIYKSSKELTVSLDGFSKGKLKKKEDIERLFEISIKTNQTEILEETAFHAKFIQGLFSIIERGENAVDEVLLERYMQEYKSALEKIRNNLVSIISSGSSFYQKIFEDKYFLLTREGMQNLTDLCYDLSWFKLYLNEFKD